MYIFLFTPEHFNKGILLCQIKQKCVFDSIWLRSNYSFKSSDIYLFSQPQICPQFKEKKGFTTFIDFTGSDTAAIKSWFLLDTIVDTRLYHRA